MSPQRLRLELNLWGFHIALRDLRTYGGHLDKILFANRSAGVIFARRAGIYRASKSAVTRILRKNDQPHGKMGRVLQKYKLDNGLLFLLGHHRVDL
jgi:hypothetical protein